MGVKLDPSSGTWTASYSKRPGPRQMPKSLKRTGFKSERDAKKGFTELIVEMSRRLEIAVVPNWAENVKSYLDSCQLRGLSGKYIHSQQCYLEGHTLGAWGARLVTEISPHDILSLHKEKVGRSSQGNQQYFLKCLRLAFDHAVQAGHLVKNPVPQIKFRVGDKIKKVLTGDQVRTLLNKAREINHGWYPHWAFALYTGMRNGELFALTWDKVSIEKNQILIDAAWTSKDGFKSTKSGNDRIIEIAPGLLPVIKELKLQSCGDSFVLPRINRWEQGDQARELRMFLIGIGLPAVRFHDLRATWATLLLSKGVEPIKVMKMGGWTDMKTMMIYIRKAGVDIAGSMQGWNLHDPESRIAQVFRLPGSAL